jgi:hypothetical protein
LIGTDSGTLHCGSVRAVRIISASLFALRAAAQRFAILANCMRVMHQQRKQAF